VPRHQTLERRLFSWLLTLLLVPALVTIAVAVVAGSRSVAIIGTLGAWDQVAESGRSLFDAAGPAARSDSVLARAVDNHQRNLSASLTQARRWTFLGQRAAAALPWLLLFVAALLVAVSMWLSRRIARELAKPITELVGWASLMGKAEPLPAIADRSRDVSEVQALREAMRDASDRIAAAQRQAIEQERVRAWGEMARRVAHEMKNPLTPLRLAVHRIANNADREAIDVIQQEIARLEELARQFGVLGRPAAGTVSEIDLVELLEGLLHSDVPAHVDTSIRSATDHILIHGYYDALLRAFRNLIRNAVDAISSAPASGSGAIEVRIETMATAVVVEIEDSGPGIPTPALDRIFEADFTLKAGGTGLGLAVVRQAIAAHGGTISASNGGRGALFQVTLPATGVVENAQAQEGNEVGDDKGR
jgi:signal transduction histidine kinase